MSEPLYLDDVHVGQTWTSGGRTITETDVVLFAGLTGDYNPLHVDHHFARDTPYRRPIAHGLLGTSFVAGLGSHAPLMKTEAFVAIREWKFLQPLFIGDTVRVTTEVLAIKNSGRKRGTVLWKRELVNQDDTTIQSGVFESIVSKRRPAKQDDP